MKDLKSWNQAVETAARRIKPYVLKTPVLPSKRLSEQLGYPVWLKCEQFQPMGAFKIRGAANALLARSPEERMRGAITYSTGNHGLAVAYIGHRLGVPTTICISTMVPEAKVNALKQAGVRLVVEGNSQDEAKIVAGKIAREEGLIMVEPFDDPYVIAGQGTISLEILEQLPAAGVVLVPLSGGGLASGVAVAIKARRPDVRVIGVSMERGAVMFESIRRGYPVELPEVETLADSLQGGIGLENRWTFSLVKEYLDDIVVVSESEIAQAMTLLGGEGLIVEGAAAVAVAVLLRHPDLRGTIVALLTGRNISLPAFCQVAGK